MQILKLALTTALAGLALAGCKQENNYPTSSETTTAAVVPVPEATSTVAVPVPGPTSTVAVPVPGPTVTHSAEPTSSASPTP